MAYADQNQSGRRTVALVIVLALHIALGYAFITGLAFNVIKHAAEDLKTFNVENPPPPPAPPPPPPQVPKNIPPPPIVSPPPIVQAPTIQAPIFQTVPQAPPVIHVQAPVAPPLPPPAPSKAVGAKPRGAPSEWVTNDDYPSDALRDNAEGTTGFKLEVDGSGKVTNCTITQSSGSSSLDSTACKLLPRRARFTPAKDAAGNGIPDTFSSRIRWQIPKD